MEKVLRRPEVERLTGLSRSRIYELMDGGRFPRPINLGGRAVAWLESEVGDWLKRRVAERDSRPRAA